MSYRNSIIVGQKSLNPLAPQIKSEDTLCSLHADGVTVITLPRGVGGLDPSKVGAVKVKAIDCADCFTSNIDDLQEKYFWFYPDTE